MTTRETKQLNKSYSKSFKRLQKAFFTDKKAGLSLFIEYLKYLRDLIVLAEYENKLENDVLKAPTIIAAIAEYEAYNQNKEQQQKSFHWNNFCELVKQNMEDWLKIDDSV